MAASRKRVPGQGNDDDEARKDANADFLGTQSLQGGGDDSFVYRGLRALFAWLDRRNGRGAR